MFEIFCPPVPCICCINVLHIGDFYSAVCNKYFSWLTVISNPLLPGWIPDPQFAWSARRPNLHFVYRVLWMRSSMLVLWWVMCSTFQAYSQICACVPMCACYIHYPSYSLFQGKLITYAAFFLVEKTNFAVHDPYGTTQEPNFTAIVLWMSPQL